MDKATTLFANLDRAIIGWMSNHGLRLLRISIGIVFLWFGALKLFPGWSPAEGLVIRTVSPFFDGETFLPILAVWEVVIGLGLITGKFLRTTLLLLFLQMPGTMLPLIVEPETVWTSFPLGLTIEGQYIVKNLVLVSAALVIGSHVSPWKSPQEDHHANHYLNESRITQPQ